MGVLYKMCKETIVDVTNMIGSSMAIGHGTVQDVDIKKSTWMR